MNAINKVRHYLVIVLEVVGGILLYAMISSTFFGVLDRFILKMGFPWPEEVARFLFIWLCFLSGVIAAIRGQHFAIDFVVSRLVLNAKSKRVLSLFVQSVTLFVVLLLVVKSIELFAFSVDQIAPATQIKLRWIYFAMPVSFSLLSIVTILGMLESIIWLSDDYAKTKQLRKKSESPV